MATRHLGWIAVCSKCGKESNVSGQTTGEAYSNALVEDSWDKEKDVANSVICKDHS